MEQGFRPELHSENESLSLSQLSAEQRLILEVQRDNLQQLAHADDQEAFLDAVDVAAYDLMEFDDTYIRAFAELKHHRATGHINEAVEETLVAIIKGRRAFFTTLVTENSVSTS